MNSLKHGSGVPKICKTYMSAGGHFVFSFVHVYIVDLFTDFVQLTVQMRKNEIWKILRLILN